MDELTLLKERATQMGIAYSPNIGLDTLKRKIQDKLDGKPDAGPETQASTNAPDSLNPAQILAAKRLAMKKEQLRLVRVRVANLDPGKADLRGEIITVGNPLLGTIRKFIPFGEAGEAGYHIPFIMYQHLKDKRFNQVKTRKGPDKKLIIEQKMVPEYAIEVLEPLTPEELKTLARNQAAAAGADA